MRNINKRKKDAITAVTIVLIIVAVIILLGSRLVTEYVTYSVSDENEQELLVAISQSDTWVGLAAPAVTAWESGESGSFLFGIRNRGIAASTYYINAYLEDLVVFDTTVADLAGEANSWLSFAQKVTILPGEKVTIPMIVRPAFDADPGVYIFRAAVCENIAEMADCHHKSPAAGYNSPSLSIYGSSQFSVKIKAG